MMNGGLVQIKLGYLKSGPFLTAFLSVVAVFLITACEPPKEPEPERAPETEPEVAEPTLSPHDAARRGDLDQLRLHHEQGLDVNIRDAYGASLLHEAASAGHLDVVEWLIERGADINARDESGFEPIQLASFMDQQDVVALLRGHGAILEPLEPAEPPVVEEVPEDDIEDLVELDEVEEVEPELPDGWEDLEFRTWTSVSGQEVEAAFLELSQDMVQLGAPDGRVSRIPLNQLSRDDQILARKLGSDMPTIERRGSRSARETGEVRVTSGFSSDCERLLVRAIQQAREEILVAIYTFTRPEVERALSRAAQRGVTVRMKYDAKQLPVSRMQELIDRMEGRGVIMEPITMSGRYASMHHKFAVIDGMTVFTGSFNFTVMAVSQNYENCVLIESVAVARDFEREYNRVRGR